MDVPPNLQRNSPACTPGTWLPQICSTMGPTCQAQGSSHSSAPAAAPGAILCLTPLYKTIFPRFILQSHPQPLGRAGGREGTLQPGYGWSPQEEEEDNGELLPSQKNMSQTRRTELQGSVREKAHMNHSVMYRMGSIFCLLRCL